MELKTLTLDRYPLQSLLFLPEKYDETTPLLIFLHGAGERGENTENLYRHAIPRMIREGHEIPAIVLCPQCPRQFVWNNVVEKLKVLIDTVAAEFSTMPDRICLTGASMGGYGTWEMGMTYPSYFAAIAPVAGGGMTWRCSKLITTPVRAYHGTKDGVVPLSESQKMVDAVNSSGGHADMIPVEGLDHCEGINEAYYAMDLIPWILAQRRTNFDYIKEICEDMF